MVGSRKVHEQTPTPALPSANDAWSRIKPSSAPRRPATEIATYHILIVDDELWAALDMEWVVRKLRHEVVGPAATAEEAIELADTARPDLVLMDIRLADDSDGVAAAIEIRERFDIPSLFVSAHGDPTTRKRAIAANPSGFIEKPFTPDSLALAIEAALKPREPSA
jgi:DNA-binding NarL/FixJ family response regulator